MKKIRTFAAILFSLLLIGGELVGCNNEAGNSGTPDTPGSTLQEQIDNTAAGGTVTLNNTLPVSSIVITRPMTVDGNGISNLSITVSSNVSSNVTLRNFSNANITVAPASSTASTNRINSRSAARDADESDDHFKKFGEDALPLHIEGCTIEKLDVKADVALYLEYGDEKKSVIEELNLKDGVEEFTFIEMDKADKPETNSNEATPTDKKSNVGELNIEGNGIEKINLIGGTFDDVNIADNFTGDAIDFKYDKEFSDQFGEFEGKAAFFEDPKIEEKDVAVVDIAAADTHASSDVYKFEIPLGIYPFFDNRFTIVFMTDDQKTTAERVCSINNPQVASIQNPIYAAIPTGAFRIDFETDDKSKPLTIFGGEGGYINYGAAYSRGLTYYERQDIVVLENYRNYNKNAFIVEFDTDRNCLIIYVNMAEVRKEDIVICASMEGETYGEAGTKMTEINLAGYKPYISFNWMQFDSHYMQANPHPQSTLTDEDREQIVNDEAGNLDRNNTPAAVLAKIDADIEANEQWDANFAAAKSFAIATAIKSTNAEDQGWVIESFIPYGNALKLSWEITGTFTPMVAADTYPNVANVEPTIKAVQGQSIYQEMLDTWAD